MEDSSLVNPGALPKVSTGLISNAASALDRRRRLLEEVVPGSDGSGRRQLGGVAVDPKTNRVLVDTNNAIHQVTLIPAVCSFRKSRR